MQQSNVFRLLFISLILINEINNTPNKKIPVSFKVKAKLGNKLEIEITDYVNKVKDSLDIITSSSLSLVKFYCSIIKSQ